MDDREWENASTNEKLKWLRDNILRLINFVNSLSGRIAAVTKRVDEL
jgi:hypothetical protein